MSFLPGSGVPLTKMALVTEKGGQLWLVDVASGRKQQVGGVPAVNVAGQGGLGDVVAAPRLRGQPAGLSELSSRRAPAKPAARRSAMARSCWARAQPRIEGFKVIWRQTPKVTGNGHFAHRIAFAPDGTIFLSSGDRQKFDPAQAFDGNLGKILHLTAEGQPVPAGHSPTAAALPPNSTRWAIATISASPSRRTGGCGRPKWAPRAATNST